MNSAMKLWSSLLSRLRDRGLSTPRPGDPRHLVTPDAFEVAPEIFGRSLAKPWRRLTALLVDLVLFTLLVEAGGVVFSVVVATAFFLVVVRRPSRHWLRSLVRVGLGGAGALVIFIVVLSLTWRPPPGMLPAVPGTATMNWLEWGRKIGSQDPAVRERALVEMAETLAADLDASGASVEEMAARIEGFELPEGERERILGLESDDRSHRLQTLLRELQVENAELRRKVENPGFLTVLRGVAEDLGLGVGWLAVYFSLFLAWWSGRTPGKWLLRLRVVRLDGRPLGVWDGFERFGGYLAGVATGLLGFAQILWDANRQGVQDKIVGTVVVAEAGSQKKVPGDS